MKKTFVLFLIICLTVCQLCGCGKKATPSNLLLSDLEKKLQESDEDLSFETKEDDSGYTFSYSSPGYMKRTYQGKTDKDFLVYSINVISEDISEIEALSDSNEIQSIITAFNGGYITIGQFEALGCIFNTLSIYEACAGYSVYNKVNDFIPLFLSGNMETNGWKISISTDDHNNTFTVTADFISK